MKVKYLGQKAPRTFPLPLPLLANSSKTGELRFEATGSVQGVEREQAKTMCEQFPELFELASEPVEKREKGEKKSSIQSAE